jgi:DNA transformation protein and related proteins
MDAESLQALFGPVAVRRMFGGSGVYAEGLCFAIEAGGDVYIKADALSQPSFSAAGSAPFTYEAKGRRTSMAYWRLPEIADELTNCGAGPALVSRSRGAVAGV